MKRTTSRRRLRDLVVGPLAVRRQLSTADAQRETVLRSAQKVFASRGLYGTPTLEIATAAGISQAYLFRLFPTKLTLFIAVVEHCNDHIHRTISDAAANAKMSGADVLQAMHVAYLALLADRSLLRLQLHAHAACDDEIVRTHVHRGYARLVELIERESSATTTEIRRFCADAMLLNALSTIHAEDCPAQWARQLLTRPDTTTDLAQGAVVPCSEY